MGLVEELKKIVELEKYKKGFISYLSRYLHISFDLDYRYARKFATKSFGSWFLDGIRCGKIINFLPREDIVRVKDLKYLAHRIGKVYSEEEVEGIPKYRPFVFTFKIIRKRWGRGYQRRPEVKKIISPNGANITFKVQNYSLSIRVFQYNRLKELYRGPPGFIDDNIFVLLLKYDFIGTKNNHLSVPPQLLHPDTVELFGSPLNTISKGYCSALSIDRAFGSKGSFFDLDITPGIYLANPPFIEDIMIEMVQKLLRALSNVVDIIIFVVIPVWTEGAGERGVSYVAWDLIKDSEYLRDHKLLDQNTYPFYDYYRDKYISVTDTHLILLSNIVNPDIDEYLRGMIKKWSQFKSLIE